MHKSILTDNKILKLFVCMDLSQKGLNHLIQLMFYFNQTWTKSWT